MKTRTHLRLVNQVIKGSETPVTLIVLTYFDMMVDWMFSILSMTLEAILLRLRCYQRPRLEWPIDVVMTVGGDVFQV